MTGCLLWLDASDPSNNGVKPTSNYTLTTWYDKSGTNVNATKGGSGTLTYTVDGLATGYPALAFTGSQYLDGSVSNTGNQLSVFIIYSLTSPDGNSQRILSLANNTTGNDYSNIWNVGYERRNNGIKATRN
jgi:hypothetical protein